MKVPEAITHRLEQLERVRATYMQYAQQRLDEQDFHGLWDVAINLAEVSNERDGIMHALAAFEAQPETSTTVHARWSTPGRPASIWASCAQCLEPYDPAATAPHVCPPAKAGLP